MTTTLLNNRYQIIQVLGAGGFGETFLAEDTHMPSRRRCVIKQLKPIANDPQTYHMIQQRFEREAATLEYLGDSSDQIPKLYAYFSEDGQFYLVQEWIYGQTLRDIVYAKGYESETTVREILLSLLVVLDYVHSKGIIHRDIKPDNIILRSLDNKPVLIDFGAVKETIHSVASFPGYPTRSLVIGTPGYMPSEQAVGRPVYATDIYSLGLTAIYLLTGKNPPELQTNQHTGEILWQDYAPHISPQLTTILNQAIKPQVSDRYSTASKMLHALKSANYTSPQPSTTANTFNLRPTPQSTQSLSSAPTIIDRNWQKPTLIVGGLLISGLIGGLAISQIGKQPIQAPITTNSSPSRESLTPTNPEISVQPSPTAVAPTSPEQPETAPLSTSDRTPETSTSPDDQPSIVNTSAPTPTATQATPDNLTPVVPTTQAPPVEQDRLRKKKDSINKGSVPAFPTGTTRSAVEAVLGKPNKDLRGLWGNTRAVTYQLVPNQIDLGYLFDRKSGVLKQTEAAFAQTVDPQVMQTTLNGMLGGQVTPEIQQGLQRIQQRQKDDFSFTQGSIKGQIVRQSCDLIYISVWDADLHDIGSPAAAKQC